MWNARIRIAALAAACEELSKYGPAKPEDLRGLDDVRSLPLETPSISACSTRAFLTPYTSQDTPLLEGQGQGATAGAAAATAAGVAPGTTVKDPSGQRCGAAPDAKAAETLQACARDASAYISKVCGKLPSPSLLPVCVGGVAPHPFPPRSAKWRPSKP